MKVCRHGVFVKLGHGRSRLLSWKLLLPFLLVLIVLAGNFFLAAMSSQFEMRTYLRNWSEVPAGREALQEYFRAALRADFWRVVDTPAPPSDSAVPVIELFVTEEALTEAILHEDSESVQLSEPRHTAFYREGKGGFIECEFRSRGANAWHRQKSKPSLRLRFSKKRASPGFRWLELSRPESALALANWLPEQLGESLGLVTPQSSHVRLMLNRNNRGVYLRSFRPGDRLALENGRLPGVFFKGDAPHLVDSTLWDKPELWNIDGELTEQQKAWFLEFLGLVTDFENQRAKRALLARYVDEEALAKFAALGIFTGSDHTDDRHNLTFYYSSYRGLLEPAVWDFNSFGILQDADTNPDRYQNRLLTLASLDPRFVHKRNLHLHDLVESNQAEDLVEQSWEKLYPELRSDQHLIQLHTAIDYFEGVQQLDPAFQRPLVARDVPSRDLPEEKARLLQWVKARKTFLNEYLSDARVSARNAPSGGVQVASFGNVAVRATNQNDSTLSFLLFPGRSDYTIKEEGFRVSPPAPIFYSLPGQTTDWEFENALNGERLENSPTFPPFDQRLLSIPIAPTPTEQKRSSVELGPGIVKVVKTTEFPANVDVTVRPGTELKLGQGVSLLFRGKVSMVGEQDNPITVSPLEESYGTLAILGPDSTGSRLEYVAIRGGSAVEIGGLHLKGMANVYDCPDVSVRDCTFSANTASDDALNVALSKVVIEDCLFVDTPLDALDLDGCEGRVTNCQFKNTGNDGLDIMESDLTVENCRFENCGDKGISIGEECRTLIKDSRFSGCVTGLELKDASRTRVTDSLFEQCSTAVNAYRKKWLFQTGGYGELVRVAFQECATDVQLDRYSKMWLRETSAAEPARAVFQEGHFDLGDGPFVRLSHPEETL